MSSVTIPTSSIFVNTSLPKSQMDTVIIDLCKDLFKKWSPLDNLKFSIENVSGGITNLLLKVSVAEDNGNCVSLIIRLYGPNTDLVIDRKRELQAIRYISEAGFGAELLGLFENGMVQSFIQANTLSLQDMSNPVIAAKIAKELRRFHEVEVPGPKEPQLWHAIFKFLEQASELKYDNEEKQVKYETISFEEVRSEICQLKELLDNLNSPVVFSHNDLLYGNLMLSENKEKLYLIDFEYGSYSYRGYDIANHFNEYAGFYCDYSLFPNKDAQYHFFRNYLQPDKPHEVSDKDLQTMYVEANFFTLASHIYWGLWALIQSKVSPIDFDYLAYFFQRYGEYKNRKKSLPKIDSLLFP
ncbi:Ethanolamine kinase [Zostera marina]|uniref:ethanolamine kinase n=1 Tax=Zostera marina TaxID=29655 RepID=A0A0K9PPE7_ZOSMR|nr:Ethanolamine kinase [Zostera marina]